MNKLYLIGVVLITFFVAFSFFSLYIFDGLIWKFVWILILDSVGFFWILLYKNYCIFYNQELITLKSLFNSKRMLKWEMLENISVNEITGMVILINKNGRNMRIMPYLNNYSSLMNHIKTQIKVELHQ